MQLVRYPISWVRQNLIKLLLLFATTSILVRLVFENQLQEFQRKRIVQEAGYRDGMSHLYSHIKSSMESGRIDSLGTHRIISGIYPARTRSLLSRDKVSLVSHCTPNHLHLVVDLARHWQGPISVAVFTPSELLMLSVQYLFYLYKCFTVYLNQTSIHFVTMYPDVRLKLPILMGDFIKIEQISCELHQEFLNFNINNYDMGNFKYPNNLLRNVAIKETVTEYIFVIDIDMIPSEQFSQHFSTFIVKYPGHRINSSSDVTSALQVFVVPAFEVEESVGNIPLNKTHLLKLWSRNKARPFYCELCDKCHQPTNYDLWKDVEEAAQYGVSHKVEWIDPWEPFFVARRSIPLFDERFTQYGFNRISQACELHVAGYVFAVLNNAFVLHHGFKKPGEFHSTKTAEQETNRLLFRQFKRELKEKYRESEKRC